MGGIGLLSRRRAIGSSPTISDIGLHSYVQDSVLMWLDGIEKGDDENAWNAIRTGQAYINSGAIRLDNGYLFNGGSYMYMENAPSYPNKGRTLEIVVEFTGNNATEVLYMAGGGLAFGRTNTELIVAGYSNNSQPSFPDPLKGYAAGKMTFSCANNNAVINGVDVASKGTNAFSGNTSTSYLGKRATGSAFKGIIHAIRIHDRVLSAEEMRINQSVDNIRFNLGLNI